ncbi:MAG: translation initiation factor IF-3, partial [Clostridia bacterium]|nr:translation initiation factor IF-3 [Clostridia bacterium]
MINDDIRAKEVRVIGVDNEQIGIFPLAEAKEMAYDKGLDLVLISPQADPPVCRIVDYGKFRFEKEKRQKEA